MRLTATEFLAIRRQLPIERGVYLLKNKTLNKYYVGQSKDMVNRVSAHFSGRGNGDVYHDYKSDHDFDVCFYFFNTHQFRDLNELERHLIRIYDCVTLGYNRKKGNRTRLAT